eukprot:TRINITY_DN6884_c0_g1_i1.p3 TRINITY_DN6884_c0_g1~~TRINITY_DN6884_c0_g1_i1.p3  ORF type:complete len:195 (+),score=53.69 TRINITY_DN6884_c0_g1_i1:161-745(+)
MLLYACALTLALAGRADSALTARRVVTVEGFHADAELSVVTDPGTAGACDVIQSVPPALIFDVYAERVSAARRGQGVSPVPSAAATAVLHHPQYLELPLHQLPNASFDIVYTGLTPDDPIRHSIHARYQPPTGTPHTVCLPPALVRCGDSTALTDAFCWSVPAGDAAHAATVQQATSAVLWAASLALTAAMLLR